MQSCQGTWCLQISSPTSQWFTKYNLPMVYPFFGWPSSYVSGTYMRYSYAVQVATETEETADYPQEKDRINTSTSKNQNRKKKVYVCINTPFSGSRSTAIVHTEAGTTSPVNLVTLPISKTKTNRLGNTTNAALPETTQVAEVSAKPVHISGFLANNDQRGFLQAVR